MKLLLDQGLPRTAASELRRHGHEVEHTGDIGMATATDDAVLARALARGQVVITLDADFHTILALSGASAPSVVRLRIQGLRGTEVAEVVQRVLAVCAGDLQLGAMVTVDERAIRVRALPLGSRP